MSKDWYKDMRNKRIVQYVREGLSYAEISRKSDVKLSQQRITAIVTSCPDYHSIVADRDRARAQRTAENATDDYQVVRNEKKVRLSPENLKEMTDGKLCWWENKLIGQIKTKAQMIVAIEILFARIKKLEQEIENFSSLSSEASQPDGANSDKKPTGFFDKERKNV